MGVKNGIQRFSMHEVGDEGLSFKFHLSRSCADLWKDLCPRKMKFERQTQPLPHLKNRRVLTALTRAPRFRRPLRRRLARAAHEAHQRTMALATINADSTA